MHHINISDAYDVLGLSQSASRDEVKSAYKKLALQYHPDKNKADDATEQFQKIGNAYNRIVKHLDGPAGGFDPEEWDEGYDSEDELDLSFFLFMFSRSFGRGGGIPFFVPRFSAERMRAQEAEEDARRERYFLEQERLRVERLAAQKQQEEARKQWEHQESIRVARLREEKKKTKKERYTKGRQENEDRVKEAKRDSQKKRSKVFERARNGDAAAVKKGIWEDNVDAAGVEPLAGMESDPSFLGQHGGHAGQKETLLHIFSRHGDHDTVEWLLDHSADPEERDSFNRTAFHVALQNAHNTIITLFLSRYPPAEDDSLSTIEPPKLSNGQEYSLLRLAMDSLSASTVKLVLDNNLFDEKELSDAWAFITSKAGSNGWHGATKEKDERRSKQSAPQKKKEWEDIKDLLMITGGFSQAPPAPTPKSRSTEAPSFQPPKSESGDVPPQESVQSEAGKHAGKGKKNRKGKKGSQIHVDQTAQSTKTNSMTQHKVPLSPSDSKTSLDADSPITNKASLEAETTPPKYPRPNISPKNAYPSPISGYPSRRESLQSNTDSHGYANLINEHNFDREIPPVKPSANRDPHASEKDTFINHSARSADGNGGTQRDNRTTAPDGKRGNRFGRRGRGRGTGAYKKAAI